LRRALATLLLVALLATGCGGSDNGAHVPERAALTVYSSLPMHGDSAPAARAVAAAQRLALADHGGRAGGRTVKLVELDSAKRDGRSWDPAIVQLNAKRAAEDPATIAYLGELDYGGSAISVPVTNDKGILQVSPFDGLTSLTQLQPGGPRSAGPERYFPNGKRSFARLVPTDLGQAAVLVDWARADGARKIAVLHDDLVYGRALSAQVVYMLDKRGLAATRVDEVDLGDKPEELDKLAKDIAADGPDKRPDAVIYTGLADATAQPLLQAIAAAMPGTRMYASSGVMIDSFIRAPGPDVNIVSPARPVREYPASGRKLLERLHSEFKGPVPVEALYGYEAMRIVLDAIDRAGPHAGDRAAVIREALRQDQSSDAGPLGPLGLTPEGDVGDQRLATYRRGSRGALEFQGLREPQTPPPAALNDNGEG
jgi:branched-chain amino acid transport system substrate-binding protein